MFVFDSLFLTDINPLDYVFWNYLQDLACPLGHTNTASLKSSVIHAWQSMSEEFVKNSCSSFQNRLREVVANKGGAIRKK